MTRNRSCFLALVLFFCYSAASAQEGFYDIASVTGKYAFTYQQTPDQLVAVNPGANTGTPISFQWQSKSTPGGVFTNISLATAATYSPGILGQSVWYRRITTIGATSYNSNTVKYEMVFIKWEDLNYVREHSVIKAGKTSGSVVDQLVTGDKLVSTTYFDGLGRPIQKNIKEVATPADGSSTWGDMVQFYEYNKLGRNPQSFLSYTTTANPGKYKTDAKTAQQGYYNVLYPGGAGNDAKAYSQVIFEEGPLDRVKEAKSPGVAWQSVAGSKAVLRTNDAAEDIKRFTIGNNETDMPALLSVGGSLVYPTNTLLVSEAIDIYGKKTLQYYDGNGLLVLRKIQLDDAPSLTYTGWICTYYVYDDMGRLRCEIEPEGVKWLSGNVWDFGATNGGTAFNEQCFVYAYDERGRAVYKKTPGVEYLRMLYDNRDRLTLTQDGSQRVKNPAEWTGILYDELDRVVLTTLYRSNATVATLAGQLAGATVTSTTGITNPGGALEDLVVTAYVAGKPSYSATKNVIIDAGFSSPDGAAFTIEIDPNAVTDPVSISSSINTSALPLNAATLAGSNCTILKYIFYDNYSFSSVKTFDASAATAAAVYAASADVLPIVASGRIVGATTGSLTRVLGTNNFLAATNYYDEDGHAIQVITQNVKLGFDIITSQYGWDGRLLASVDRHAMPGNELDKYDIKTKYLFDQIGRATSIQKQFGSNALWTMASYKFDDQGRVKRKTLDPAYTHPIAGIGIAGAGLEFIDYSYDVQGTVIGLNKDYALKASGYDKWKHFFGSYYAYGTNEVEPGQARLNGQMAAQVWNTQGDDAQRKYNYQYDAAGRISKSLFTQRATTSLSWTATELNFEETGGSGGNMDYDLNGNIKSLQRYGFQFGNTTPVVLDDLRYTYQSNGLSNKLESIADVMPNAGINGSQGDFKDGNTSGPDYVYDLNGNLVIDLNKSIKDQAGVGTNGVKYNHLDKPEEINIAAKGVIKIVYDADGSKLKRQFTSATTGVVKTTWYIGSYVYEETNTSTIACQFIAFEEGRIRPVTPRSDNNGYDAYGLSGNVSLPNSKQGSIDYYIVDQRHDVRMILTEETQWSYSRASMETDNGRGTIEQGLFGQQGDNNEVSKTRMPKSTAPGWAFNTSNYISQLNSTNKVGPNQLLKVMAGDLINANVEYYYQSAVTNTSGSTVFSSVIGMLAGAILNSPAVSGVKDIATVTAITGNLSTGTPFSQVISPDITSETENKPKAYLNVVFFDERFKFVGEGSTSLRVQESGDNKRLGLMNIKVPKNGYCLVYVSNENSQNVYFDDLKVRHDRGRIIEENHYYSSGLKIAALSSKAFNGPSNNYLYQGDFAEYDEDLGWEDFLLRSYDPQIGRFLQADPYDQFASPYVGMGNNPVNGIDPSGGFAGMGIGASMIAGAAGGALIGGGAALISGNSEDAWKWALGGAVAGALVGLSSEINLRNLGNIQLEGSFFQRLDVALMLRFASIFSESARDMIEDVKRSPHKVKIKYSKYEEYASTDHDDWEDATKKGQVYDDLASLKQKKGNGKGTGTEIFLSRRRNRGQGDMDIEGGYSNSQLTSLLHELVHAWQAGYGKLDQTFVDGLRNFEREAVDWENVFRSELGRTLRNEYTNFTKERIRVYNADFKERAKKSDPRKK